MKKQKIDIGMLPRAIPIYSDCHFSWCEQGYAKFVRVKAKKQYFVKKENRRGIYLNKDWLVMKTSKNFAKEILNYEK